MSELGKDEIADIFVGTEIIFHMSKKDAEPDKDKILAALKKHKVKSEGDMKSDKTYIL